MASNGNGSRGPTDYEKKFADFIQMCNSAKKQGFETVVVAYPGVIGNNYEEIIESLSRLADARLALSVASR